MFTGVTDTGHSLLAPSGSARWISCPASIEAIAKLNLEYKDSAAAQEGTAAHQLAEEYCIDPESDPSEVLDFELSADNGILYNSEMVKHIETYRSYCYEHLDGYEDFTQEKVFVEYRAALFYREKDKGTMDWVNYQESTKTLHIIDLKYGMSLVEAPDNTQLIIYAICALRDFDLLFDIEKVVVHIAQPRRSHFDCHEYTIEELDIWSEKIKKVVKLIDSGKAYSEGHFCPSEKACQWCPLSGACKAQAEDIFKEVAIEDIDFEMFDHVEPAQGPGMNLKKADLLSFAEIGRILKRKKEIESFLKKVYEMATLHASKGTKIPGYKRVATLKNRAWTDAEKVDKLLAQKLKKDERYSAKFISPAKAEQLLKEKGISTRYKNKLDALIFRGAGKPALVPDSDIRPEIEEEDDLDLMLTLG